MCVEKGRRRTRGQPGDKVMRIQIKYAILAILFFVILSGLNLAIDSVLFGQRSFEKWFLFGLTGEAMFDRSVVAIVFFLFGVFAARAREMQKKTEQALRDSETRFQVMVESAPLGICFLDGTGVLSSCNEHFVRFVGRPKDEIIGARMDTLVSQRAHTALVDLPLNGNVGHYSGEQLFTTSDAALAVRCWFIPLLSAGGSCQGIIGIVEDVTEHREAERRLRESEQRLELAVWGAELGLWDHNLLSKQVVCNDFAAAVLGYAKEEIVPTIDSWRALIHPADLPHVLKAYTAHLNGETAFYESEHRLRSKSGEWIWILARGKVVDCDQTGRAVRLVGVGLDITGRKSMEKTLKDSEEKFRTLFEQSQQPVAIVTLDGQFVEVNQSFLELVGYARKDLAQLRFADLCTDPSAGAPWEQEADDRGYVSNVEWNAHTKSGELRNCILSATFMRTQGEIVQCQVACQDVTELKRAQVALLETVASLNALLDATPDVVYFKDAKANFKIVNKAFEKVVGLDREQILGKKTALPFAANVAEQESLYDDQVLRDRKAMRIEEVIGNEQEGGQFFETVKFPVLDHRGEVIGLGAMARDITARKTIQRQLEESLAEKEVLIGEIHHRVKNNLQVMSSLLDMQAGRITDKRSKAILKDAENRIWSMALAHEKLFRSKNLARIRVRDYLEDLVLDIVYSHGNVANLVRPVLDIDDVSLEIDTLIPLGLIANELVSNALRHTFPAGTAGEIRVSLRSTDVEAFALSVTDNGEAMIEDTSAIGLNQPFGLHLVELLLKQLRGQMRRDTTEGTGFHIVFRKMERKKRS
jgi:PAS domain S-box-containing protein